MNDPKLQVLSAAAARLYYISETDAPLEAVQFPAAASAEAALRAQLALPETVPVEIQEPAYFFRNELRPDRPDAARFRALLEELNRLLPDAQVFRVGTVRIDVYIIGLLQDGSYGGLHTVVVET